MKCLTDRLDLHTMFHPQAAPITKSFTVVALTKAISRF
jgi:hypothetical protein